MLSVGLLLLSVAVFSSAAPTEKSGEMIDCVLDCRVMMKEYMYSNLKPDIDLDSTICLALDEMYRCLSEVCELKDDFLEEVKSVVDTSQIVRCEKSQNKASDLAVVEKGLAISTVDKKPSLSGITKCLSKCQKEAVSSLDTVRTHPLASLLTNVTLDEARMQTNEACTSIDQLLDCFENKCDVDGSMLKLAKEKIQEMEIMDVCKDKELQEDLLKCEIDNKQKFIDNCGQGNLTEYSKITDETPAVLGEIYTNPFQVFTPEFREHFGNMCRYTTIIVKCSHKTYKQHCSPRAQKYMTNSLSQVINLATPEELSLLGGECSDMASVVQTLSSEQ